MVWVSIVIVAVMVGFSLFSIFDLLVLKDRFHLGSQFKKAFALMGPLFLSIAGLIASVPLLSYVIKNSLGIVFNNMGLDPSVIASSLLAIDMGGYQLSLSICNDNLVGLWSATVNASMLGATIIFSIPVGFSYISKKHYDVFFKGLIFGVVSIPLGSFIGGLILKIEAIILIKNLAPSLILSLILVILFIVFPKPTIKVLKVLANIIYVFGYMCFAIAMVKDLVLVPIANTGAFDIVNAPFINLFNSLSEGAVTAGSICLILCGSFPLVYCLNRLLKKLIDRSNLDSKKCSVNGISGYLMSLTNNVAMLSLLNGMNKDEQIYNVAFSITGAFCLGGQLAFCASNAPNCVLPMLVAKIISGISAVFIAYVYVRINKSYEKRRVRAS